MSHTGNMADIDDWRMFGSCVDVDPNVFYPSSGDPDFMKKLTKAKSICSNCEVKVECLVQALENDEYGVWGGLSERQRSLLRGRLGEKFDLVTVKKALVNYG